MAVVLLLLVTPIIGFCNCSIFCYFMSILVCDHHDGEKRELDALLSLSSWCLMLVLWLFLSVPWVCLQFVIVIFPNHTHLQFLGVIHANSDGFGETAHLLGLV